MVRLKDGPEEDKLKGWTYTCTFAISTWEAFETNLRLCRGDFMAMHLRKDQQMGDCAANHNSQPITMPKLFINSPSHP